MCGRGQKDYMYREQGKLTEIRCGQEQKISKSIRRPCTKSASNVLRPTDLPTDRRTGKASGLLRTISTSKGTNYWRLSLQFPEKIRNASRHRRVLHDISAVEQLSIRDEKRKIWSRELDSWVMSHGHQNVWYRTRPNLIMPIIGWSMRSNKNKFFCIKRIILACRRLLSFKIT